MNELEARSALAKHVNKYRLRSYEYLSVFACLGLTDIAEVVLPTGGKCKIDVQVTWEEKPNGNVRLVARIHEGGTLAGRSSITDTFVIDPSREWASR